MEQGLTLSCRDWLIQGKDHVQLNIFVTKSNTRLEILLEHNLRAIALQITIDRPYIYVTTHKDALCVFVLENNRLKRVYRSVCSLVYVIKAHGRIIVILNIELVSLIFLLRTTSSLLQIWILACSDFGILMVSFVA